MRVRKQIIGAALAAALGCAGAASAQQATPDQLAIAAGPQGSINYAISAGMAALATNHVGINTIAVAYAGTALALPLVQQGDPLIGVNTGPSVYQGFAGVGEFDRKHPALRLLSAGSSNNLAIAVKETSPIKTGADLRGKRVPAQWPAIPACHAHTTAMLANLGLSWDDVKPVPVTNVPTAARALADDRVDAHLCASPAIAALREVNATSPLRFISIDPAPEAMARARKVYQYNEKATLLKKGAMGWLPSDTWTLDYPWTLYANASLPDDIAYRFVKAVWEHNDELVKVHPIFRQWTQESMLNPEVGVPYHPGAVRFFKEKGVWTPAAEAAQKMPAR